MELTILSENENALFGRKEIRAELTSEITPNRLQVLDLISKKFACPIENIKIIGVNGSFGTKDFIIEANVYKSKSDKDVVELKKKKEIRPSLAELKEGAAVTPTAITETQAAPAQ